MNLKPYVISLANVVFKDKTGSKIRPVLVVRVTKGAVLALSITSQYQSKSPAIRKHYFEILDWMEAGLRKPSWVDTITVFQFQPDQFKNLKAIGSLTQRDKMRFITFYRRVLQQKDN